MTLKYLKKLTPILNKVGKKHGITVEEGEIIMGEFFNSLKCALTDPRIPKVKVPCMGTFFPRRKYIYRSLKSSIHFYKLGGTTREYLNSRIRRIWPVRNRLIKEQNKENTWKEWKKEEVRKKLENLFLDEKRQKKKSSERIFGSGDYPKESKDIFRKVQK